MLPCVFGQLRSGRHVGTVLDETPAFIIGLLWTLEKAATAGDNATIMAKYPMVEILLEDFGLFLLLVILFVVVRELGFRVSRSKLCFFSIFVRVGIGHFQKPTSRARRHRYRSTLDSCIENSRPLTKNVAKRTVSSRDCSFASRLSTPPEAGTPRYSDRNSKIPMTISRNQDMFGTAILKSLSKKE